MRALRPWTLLGIPLAAEVARLAGAPADNYAAVGTFVFGSALALALWLVSRVRAPSGQAHPMGTVDEQWTGLPVNYARQQRELEALRQQCAHLQTMLEWHERLASQERLAVASAPRAVRRRKRSSSVVSAE